MATTFTHRIGVVYNSDAGTVSSTTGTFTADTEVNHIGVYNAGTVNSEIDVTLTLANLKSMVLWANAAVTLKTNSTVAADTIVMVTNAPIFWNTDTIPVTKPFTTAITKIFLSCTNTATFRLSFLVDQTP